MPLTPSPSVLRATDLLEHLAGRTGRPCSVSELAREVGLPRATCDTILLALADRGYVRRDGDLRYELGPACVVLGDAAQQADASFRAAGEEAERLARSLAAFTAVSIRDGMETRVARVFDFGPPLSLRARVGESMPMVPPFGASFVAWDDDGAVETWLGRAEPVLAPRESQSYRHALAAVRERGFSVTLVTPRQPELIDALEHLADHPRGTDARRVRDEAARHVAHSQYLPTDLATSPTFRIAQVSAPVFGGDGRVVATLMVLGPMHDLTAEEVAELGRHVRAAAGRATAESGGTGPTR